MLVLAANDAANQPDGECERIDEHGIECDGKMQSCAMSGHGVC